MKIKNFKFIALCLLCGLLGSCFYPTTPYAASKTAKVRKVYQKLLESGSRLEDLSFWNKGVSWSKAQYVIMDINRDGIPEMLVKSNVTHGSYHMMLVGYVNGKAKCITHTPVGTTTGTGRIDLYPSKKMVCLVTYKGYNKVNKYCKFNGKTLEERFESRESASPGHPKIIDYKIGGRGATQKEYTAYKAKSLNGTKAIKVKWKKTNPGKKDKTAYYSATSHWYAQLAGRKDFISKISYSGNKVTIKGTLMKAPAFGKSSILLRNGSRTFKMTKYCEYYYIDGRGGDDFGYYGKRISKKKYFKTVNENDHFIGGVYIYTNSKGEIYRMIVDYSM